MTGQEYVNFHLNFKGDQNQNLPDLLIAILIENAHRETVGSGLNERIALVVGPLYVFEDSLSGDQTNSMVITGSGSSVSTPSGMLGRCREIFSYLFFLLPFKDYYHNYLIYQTLLQFSTKDLQLLLVKLTSKFPSNTNSVSSILLLYNINTMIKFVVKIFVEENVDF